VFVCATLPVCTQSHSDSDTVYVQCQYTVSMTVCTPSHTVPVYVYVYIVPHHKNVCVYTVTVYSDIVSVCLSACVILCVTGLTVLHHTFITVSLCALPQ